MNEEAKPQPETTAASEAPKWITSEDGVYEAYADWYHINWMPLTVRIRFAQVISDPAKSPGEGRWLLEERVALTMPYATAKAMAEFLTSIVQAYEKENGEVIVPKIPTL
jgi:hypothetical protein